MNVSITLKNISNNNHYITNEDVTQIVGNYLNTYQKVIIIDDYIVQKASDKMLGYLCDYLKLRVWIGSDRKELCFFIKAISKFNEAKAEMVKEYNLYNKELNFYSVIKKHMTIPGIKPWSAELVVALNDAMVFEDLNALNYKLRNKFHRFDMQHTLQALTTVARFHATSIIYEEKLKKEQQRPYSLVEDFNQIMDTGGYNESCVWFLQCMDGALKSLKAFSKFDDKDKYLIESRWSEIWFSALRLSSPSSTYRNVICHRDLWNNNLMFHYNDEDQPDNCLFVDFQAIRYQPPAGDLMVLLYCNLDPKFREENMIRFLNHYYEEMRNILHIQEIYIDNIMSKEDFFASAEEQRLWGIVVCACLLPQMWIDDDLATEVFSDTEQFDNILSNNKAEFIINMMKENISYKEKVMEIFEEIVARYCFKEII